MRCTAVSLLLAGCAASPVATPGPVACASATIAGASAPQLGVAATSTGASVVWAGGGPVMRLDLDDDGAALAAPQIAWPGTFDAAIATSVAGRVVVGAVAGETTMLLEAPFGFGAYHELALLGGIVGTSPVVVAGDQLLAPNLWYGGLLVTSLDATWSPHTAQLGVSTSSSTELAATAAGDEAVIAWPAGDACFVERVQGIATGTGSSENGACRAPRLASIDGGVALAFERPDGVYLAVAGTAADLHPAQAALVAAGAHAPRIVASGGQYWLSYLDAGGNVVVQLGDQTLALGTATAHELAVFGGAPRELAIDANGLTVTALCAE
jgi:hypothetical protein